MPDLKERELLTEERYRELREEHGEAFVARMGAEGIKELLQQVEQAADVVPEVELASGTSMGLEGRARRSHRRRLALVVGLGLVIAACLVVVLLAALRGLSPEVFDAGSVDGAGRWAAFRYLTLPLLLPGIVAGAMLAFTLSLDDFVISFFTAGPDSVTLPLFIFAAVRRGVTPQIHALSTLVVLITVILIIGMERLTRK